MYNIHVLFRSTRMQNTEWFPLVSYFQSLAVLLAKWVLSKHRMIESAPSLFALVAPYISNTFLHRFQPQCSSCYWCPCRFPSILHGCESELAKAHSTHDQRIPTQTDWQAVLIFKPLGKLQPRTEPYRGMTGLSCLMMGPNLALVMLHLSYWMRQSFA